MSDYVEVEQGTQEWIQARVGKVTASRLAQVLAQPKKKGEPEATTRRNYKAQIVCERLTGRSAEIDFENEHIRRGKALEPEARVEYELRCMDAVKKVGFVEHPTIPRFGCSPDALVGDEGLAQIKCPIPAVHLDYLKLARAKEAPTEYYAQMQAEMSCTGRQWNDFVSYCKQMPDHLQVVIIRVPRDEKYIQLLETAVAFFNAEVDEMIAALPSAEKVDV